MLPKKKKNSLYSKKIKKSVYFKMIFFKYNNDHIHDERKSYNIVFKTINNQCGGGDYKWQLIYQCPTFQKYPTFQTIVKIWHHTTGHFNK